MKTVYKHIAHMGKCRYPPYIQSNNWGYWFEMIQRLLCSVIAYGEGIVPNMFHLEN